MTFHEPRLSAPNYPRGGTTENGEDFDFDDTVQDNNSLGGGLGGGMGGPPGYTNFGGPSAVNSGVTNPHLNHMLGGGAGDAALGQEREEIDLRGRVLQEQLENHGLDPQNNFRIGGNHFSINDPNKPPYTPFYLMVTGHV